MPSKDTLDILLVEDNKGDVLLFREAAEAAGLKHELRVIGDGLTAVEVLHQYARASNHQPPDLIVLDLNLPGRTGREVLAEMTNLPSLRALPVAVLTTSESESQVCDLYCAGRCLYFTKTDDFSRLQEIVKSIMSHSKAAGES